MRLKSLELLGFKSFVDRTVIHFEDGVTGIVGPNGCGKSNVVDAIRWTMGEQSAKHLRGGQMEDVIFNGTDTRSPTGYAESRLTFDNADGRAPAEYASYGEIEVGRRLYRSGESEYTINKTPCRLRDVIDLFLGTGVGTKAYSIVEQGMIGTVISSKPEERRLMIEEAAGISKFKARKEAALRKMEATKQNLARLADIINELSRQTNSLQRQARKARRHQELCDELKGRELKVAATRYQQLTQTLSDREAEERKLDEAHAAAVSALATREAEIETKRLSLLEAERELDTVQQDLYAVANTVKLHEAAIDHQVKEVAATSLRTQEAQHELVGLEERCRQLAARLTEMNEKHVVADLLFEQLAESANGATEATSLRRSEREMAAHHLEEARQAAQQLAAILIAVQARSEELGRRREELLLRVQVVEEKIQTATRRRHALEKEIVARTTEVGKRRQLALSLGEETSLLRARSVEAGKTLEEAQTQLRSLESELATVRSRQESLAELAQGFEGYHEGVKAILQRARDLPDRSGVLGTVSELFEVDSRYERAVASALGERLEYVVVEAQAAGVAAIDYLRTNQSGRGTFIPLSVRGERGSVAFPSGAGVIGPMLDVIRMKADVAPIGRSLLGDVVMVEDLATATRLAHEHTGTFTAVTLDGEVVRSSGILSGGSSNDASVPLLARKRTLKDLGEDVVRLEEACARARAEVQSYAQQLKAMEQSLERCEREGHGEALNLVGLDRDVTELHNENTRWGETLTTLGKEGADLKAEEDNVESEAARCQQQISELTTDRAAKETRVTILETELATCEGALAQHEQALTEARVRHAEAQAARESIAREVEQLVGQKADAQTTVERRLADIRAGEEALARLELEGVALKTELDEAVQRAGTLTEQSRVLRTRYEQGVKELEGCELSLRELRRVQDDAREQSHQVALKLSELRGQTTYLAAGIRDRYHVELSLVVSQYATDDPTFALEGEEQSVEELKRKLEQLGSVNVDAVREYEDLSSRHEFLTKQHADLTESLAALERAIARINRTSRARFRETFEAVDRQFQTLFPKLFRGGRAKLVLTNEEDLLESGVEIVASPPGKKLQSILLLSGGEKALTAVALIFSIFLIKPSPFCLLDEVDAPLDDANIDRFNDLIRGMTPHSQFILITHNKRTMELADLLYGVTMEEAGVSRMVSVKLNQETLQPESAVA